MVLRVWTLPAPDGAIDADDRMALLLGVGRSGDTVPGGDPLMTVRANILANLRSTLQGISSLQDIFVGKLEPVPDLEALNIPSAWVFPDEENMARESPAMMESWDWDVVLEVWANDDDLEALLGAIHRALAADVTRGGHAQNCYRTRLKLFAVDPARSLGAMQLTYRILYRHPHGQP